ncbi:hypothetical protein Rsl_103 [Rickettsia slovaca 13-B]|uniref:Uncharacterized protein n=1 Tax=Rickettsia slovaca (strain 13-B) TaxID=941638 RepID=A0ABM5MNP6_RICS1|nr:hypothetical protein Rsl_103 [Rickettsia slovaca 13-B]
MKINIILEYVRKVKPIDFSQKKLNKIINYRMRKRNMTIYLLDFSFYL